MILLDTNVLIYASTEGSPFLEWARRRIAEGVSEDGAAVNAVSLAEICVGDAEPEQLPIGSGVGGSPFSTSLWRSGSVINQRQTEALRTNVAVGSSGSQSHF